MRALIVVDLQNDFLPGGALAVARGDETIAVANRAIAAAEHVVFTQDFHPPDHQSFASQHPGRRPGEVIDLHGLPQVLWPDHCVENTGGALFASGLETRRVARVFPKGTDRAIDSYSGFFDNGHRKATGLHEYLQHKRIGELDVLGLATDYCVKATALDAVKLGYRVRLFTDGCRAVELSAGDGERALAELAEAGVVIVST